MKISHNIVLTIFVMFSGFGYANASPKVTQAAYVKFDVNDVAVLAVEEFDKAPLLAFHDGKDIIESIQFGEDFVTYPEFAPSNAFLRFKRLDIYGLLSPVVIGIAASPRGSDWLFEANIIGERHGQLTVLNPEPIMMNILDGFYLGDMGSPHGYGMITWRFLWENEAHYDPHRYEIHLYTWDSQHQQFSLQKSFATQAKYTDGCDALTAYTLPCKNVRNMVIDEGDFSTLGIEHEKLSMEPDER